MSEIKPKRKPVDRRLVVILLIIFVQIVGSSMVLPMLPIYATSRFNMSFASVTLLNATFFGAQFLAGPVLGRLSDRYGRLPVLLVSQVGTVISFLMLGMAGNVTMLFMGRLLDGITGGNIIAAQAYVTDITPREDRTRALGYVFAAFGLGFIFGPVAGGILSLLSYEAAYIIAAIAAIIVVLLTYFVLDESLTPEQRQKNQQTSREKMDFAHVIHNMPLVSILIIGFVAQFGFALLQSTFALYGETVLFASQPEIAQVGIGVLFGMFGVGQIVTQLYLIQRVINRFGESPLVVWGITIRALALFLLMILPHVLPTAIALMLFACGTGLLMPSLQSLTTSTVPENQRGGVLGLFQSATSLGVICGSTIAGSLFTVSPLLPFLVGLVMFAAIWLPLYRLMHWSRSAELRRKTLAAAVPQPLAAGD